MRRMWLLAAVFALSRVTLQAQLIQDINPDNSSLDRFDPDGASGGRVNGLAAVVGDNQTFYAASEWGGLFKTEDGGRIWTRLDRHLPVATWAVEVDPTNPQIVYATSFYDGRANSLAGINVSYNAGANWTHPPSTTPPPGLCSETARTEPAAFGISISPNAPQNVFIGTNCGLAVSHDGRFAYTMGRNDDLVRMIDIEDDACEIVETFPFREAGDFFPEVPDGRPVLTGDVHKQGYRIVMGPPGGLAPDNRVYFMSWVQSTIWSFDVGSTAPHRKLTIPYWGSCFALFKYGTRQVPT